MNYNENKQSQKQWRVAVILIVALLIVGGIIYLKRSSSVPSEQGAPNGSSPSSSVAVPDTTVEPGVLPQVGDSVEVSVLPDTLLGKDHRNPYEAGYEDGYATGCDDGAAGTERASYDETSYFRTQTERNNYARGYREGYEKGYADGTQGNQFNIKSEENPSR